MRRDHVVVMGAGPAGLAFAHRYGRGALVLEKSDDVGGLSRSIEILDGVFDIGGHSFHTPHPEVLALVRSLMGDAWHQQPRDARVWVAGESIPYPFQHHFEKLSSARIVRDCLGHRPDPDWIAQSVNFEEWIMRRFGQGVAEHFMLPYNRKLWACDLASLTCDWVEERVATDKTHDITTAAARTERRPLLSNSLVGYPAEGGFAAIFKALARQCHHIELGQEIVRVDPDQHAAYNRAGTAWSWRSLVSTIPLPRLLQCMSDCPARLARLASELEAVSLKILLILVSLRQRSVPQRVYIADPAVPAHKIAFNHTSSPSLASRENHAIMCEVSYSSIKPAPSDQVLLATTTDWLIDNGYVESRDDIVSNRVLDVPFGYPVPTHSKSGIVAEISSYLETKDIYSIGRFGAWNYANSDECIRHGLALADRLRK